MVTRGHIETCANTTRRREVKQMIPRRLTFLVSCMCACACVCMCMPRSHRACLTLLPGVAHMHMHLCTHIYTCTHTGCLYAHRHVHMHIEMYINHAFQGIAGPYQNGISQHGALSHIVAPHRTCRSISLHNAPSHCIPILPIAVDETTAFIAHPHPLLAHWRSPPTEYRGAIAQQRVATTKLPRS